MLPRFFLLFTLLCGPLSAQPTEPTHIVDEHILPGYLALENASHNLAEAGCDRSKQALIIAYHGAFDAWIGVAHLRFGPSEKSERAFALAFWPDGRGATPKTLSALLNTRDPSVDSAEQFTAVSIAGRGFYALEFLLFDQRLSQMGEDAYRCALITAITADIARNAAAIHTDWKENYADLMRDAGENDTYRTRDEALRQLLTALSTGLEFTESARLGRPLGSFERPRPRRAEAWRSGRSLRHVSLSLAAMRDLARHLSGNEPKLDDAFSRAIARAEVLDDPVFANVATPQGRIEVEALQQAVARIKTLVDQELGPRLGVAAGFNSLDGD